MQDQTSLSSLPRGAALIGQSGGPTAVINQSLVGVIEGLRMGLFASGHIDRILGMRHGVKGLTKGEVVDCTAMHQDKLDNLALTPSAALGSTRDKPDAAYCERVLESCKKLKARYFFYIGGNDSSDTCRIISEMAQSTGYDMRCFHVPKTVDNDLMENDHTPGFPSAARFVAMACMADFMDNISLPGIKINVVMGRHAGFLTGASALARRRDRALDDSVPTASTDGPQLIYCPEVPFDMERFVADVDSIYSVKGRCHIVVSEGICDREGKPIAASLIKNGQVDAHGNVQLSGSGALGDQLGDFLKAKLTPVGGKPPRVRADTFGYVQRCWPDASIIDRIEARRSGRFAATLALQGHISGSVAIVRTGSGSACYQPQGEAYASDYKRVELSAIAAKTRHMPPEFLSGHNNVSRKFIEFCLPLVGELPGFERL